MVRYSPAEPRPRNRLYERRQKQIVYFKSGEAAADSGDRRARAAKAHVVARSGMFKLVPACSVRPRCHIHARPGGRGRLRRLTFRAAISARNIHRGGELAREFYGLSGDGYTKRSNDKDLVGMPLHSTSDIEGS
jgi:hypothetical protein